MPNKGALERPGLAQADGPAAPDSLRIEEIDPLTSPLWPALTEALPASVFHTSEWMKVIAGTYGFRFSARLLMYGDKPAAGVAWCQLSDILGTRRVSLPFCDYADVLSTQPAHTQLLIESVRADGVEWTLRSLSENVPAASLNAASTGLAKWMAIDLTGSGEQVMARIDPAARKGIRKAEKRGVSTRLATEKSELREWFMIHLAVRKRKHALLAQPYSFFEAIWDTFIAPGRGFLVLTVFDGQVIGGMFCLQLKDVCYTKFSASKSEFNVHKANNLLQWATMAEARRRSCRLLDMGRNPLSAPGLIYFKQAFGAFEKDLLALTYRPDGTPQADNADQKALLRRLTELFVSETVPDDITEKAGDLLYKYFA
jgi:hypothetical protein